MWSQYEVLTSLLNNLIDAMKYASFWSNTLSPDVILLLSIEELIAVDNGKSHGTII